ncbi:hypothetical protein AGLY_002457 [Aphis glycines]|uniref:Uncharacterized protein n=1 Tax=Aphis glycines TaxID=307491 RepID=A0A6G0U2U0_APHGL|nr:hypothetical protein AGLY_002457 [Aphis glycines]
MYNMGSNKGHAHAILSKTTVLGYTDYCFMRVYYINFSKSINKNYLDASTAIFIKKKKKRHSSALIRIQHDNIFIRLNMRSRCPRAHNIILYLTKNVLYLLILYMSCIRHTRYYISYIAKNHSIVNLTYTTLSYCCHRQTLQLTKIDSTKKKLLQLNFLCTKSRSEPFRFRFTRSNIFIRNIYFYTHKHTHTHAHTHIHTYTIRRDLCKYQTSYLSQTQTRIQKRFSRKVFIRTKLETNYITLNTNI